MELESLIKKVTAVGLKGFFRNMAISSQ